MTIDSSEKVTIREPKSFDYEELLASPLSIHLAVLPQFRGQGIAAALMAKARERP